MGLAILTKSCRLSHLPRPQEYTDHHQPMALDSGRIHRPLPARYSCSQKNKHENKKLVVYSKRWSKYAFSMFVAKKLKIPFCYTYVTEGRLR